MTIELAILVGTMTGTAQLVAQEIELALEADDLAISVVPLDGQEVSLFRPGRLYLVCTSTYGQGDVPDNARALFDALDAGSPDLSGITYGLIALGDRTYADTFAFGGRRFDALLTRLGARRVGEPLIHDASSGTLPEDEAVPWAHDWLALVRASETIRTGSRSGST